MKPGVPLCLSCGVVEGLPDDVTALLVGEHATPDTGGDLAFEAAHGRFASLAFFDLAVKVSTASTLGHAYLGHRDQMHSGVQLAVAAAEP